MTAMFTKKQKMVGIILIYIPNILAAAPCDAFGANPLPA